MQNRVKSAFEPKRPRPEGSPEPTRRQLFKAWWQACRPPFLIVDLIPVGLAFVLAERDLGYWPWGLCIVVLLGCFFLHTVSNIANDLFDYLCGVDTEDSIGGTHIIQSGLISPRQISVAIIVLVAATILIGAWLVIHSDQYWLCGPIVFAILSAIFYVAPPIRYGCRGLGEVFVGINMGFIMLVGAHAVMAGMFSLVTLAFALPVALMVAGILYFQSLPEIETDLAAGKRTLANILGKEKAEFVFRLWWPVVWMLMVNLHFSGLAGWPVYLFVLTVPFYWKTCRLIHNATEWLDLDQHGHLVRKLYLINGIFLIAGAILV